MPPKTPILWWLYFEASALSDIWDLRWTEYMLLISQSECGTTSLELGLCNLAVVQRPCPSISSGIGRGFFHLRLLLFEIWDCITPQISDLRPRFVQDLPGGSLHQHSKSIYHGSLASHSIGGGRPCNWKNTSEIWAFWVKNTSYLRIQVRKRASIRPQFAFYAWHGYDSIIS